MNKKFEKNIKILEENDVKVCNTKPVWDEYPDSVELEYYTPAGGDMIIELIEPTKDELRKYLVQFDMDEEVMMWWRNGKNAAQSRGVPFANPREHYEDLEAWRDNLQAIADLLD